MSHYMNQIGVCSKFKTCISAALRLSAVRSEED